MSSFFARLKKRGTDKHQPEPQPAIGAVAHKSEEKTETTNSPQQPSLPTVELESPKRAVEMDSIFKGLKLSSQVAHSERSDSPYLQTSQDGGEDEEESNGDSKFSFLHDQPDNNDSESEKSSDEQSSSFAFLNVSSTSPQESLSKDKVLDEEKGVDDVCSTAEPQTQPTEKQPQPTQNAETSNIRTKPLLKSPGGRTVGRQAPPTGAHKKKKRRAIRPGGAQQTEQTDGEVPSIGCNEKLITTSEEKLITTSEEELMTTSQIDGESLSVFTSNVGKAPSVSEDDVADTNQGAVKSEDSSQSQSLVDEIQKDHSQVEESIINCVTMETQEEATKSQAVPADIGSPANLGAPAEGVASPDSPSEPVTLDTVDESPALEEVFGNYHIELSGEDSLAALLQSYESSIKKIREGGASNGKEQSHSDVIEKELSSLELLIRQRSEVQRLKADETKALADEDYELAEQLSKQLEQIALVSEWDSTKNGLKAIKEWMKQCAELSESERDLRTSTQAQLTTLKEEHSQVLQEINKQLASFKNKEKMRVQALQDKIDRDRGHLALDREHFERSEAKLKGEVESRAAQSIAAKVELEDKLSQVESEISTLELKLLELQKERDRLREGISAEEVTIAAVKDELSAEQLQLDKEREQIELRDRDLKEEEEKLSKERHKMAATLLEEENKRDSLAKVIDLAGMKSAELASVGESLEKLLSQLQPLVDDCQSKMKPSEHIIKLHEKCANCALAVETVSGDVLATQTKLSSLTKKVSDDEVLLQQLTDAKQAAVTGRQFKEAGRLAAESKALSAKLEEERSEVKTTSAHLEELSGQLSEISARLEAVRKDTDLQEQKEDAEHIEHLTDWSRELRQRSESVHGTALQEVLEKWCKLNELLRESLATKHGLTVTMETEKTPPHCEPEIDVPTEERTPGVGSEVRAEEGSDSGERSSAEAKMEETERAKLRERQVAIEADLERACQEEDYGKAAELDEELQSLKKLLGQS